MRTRKFNISNKTKLPRLARMQTGVVNRKSSHHRPAVAADLGGKVRTYICNFRAGNVFLSGKPLWKWPNDTGRCSTRRDSRQPRIEGAIDTVIIFGFLGLLVARLIVRLAGFFCRQSDKKETMILTSK